MAKPRKPRKPVTETDSSEKEASPTRLVNSNPSNKRKDQDKLAKGKKPETTISGPNPDLDRKKKKQDVEEDAQIPSTPRKRAASIIQKPKVESKHNQAQPDPEDSATRKRTSKKQSCTMNESVKENSKTKTDSEDSAAKKGSSMKHNNIKDDSVNVVFPTKSPSGEDSKDSNFVFQQVTSKPILKKEESGFIRKRSSSFKTVRLGQSVDLLSGEKYKVKNEDEFQVDQVMNDKLEARHEVGSNSRNLEMTAVKSDSDRRIAMRESHKNRITMVDSKIAEKQAKHHQQTSNTSTASAGYRSGTEADEETIESEERTWDPETASCGGTIIKKFQNTPEDIQVVLRESAKYDLCLIDSDSDSDDFCRRARDRQLSIIHDLLNKNIENMTERERKRHNINLRKYKRQVRLAEEARTEAERRRLEEKLKKYFLKEIVIEQRPKKKKNGNKTKVVEDDYDGDESSSIEFSQSEIQDIVRDILETRAELYQALNQEKEQESDEEEGPTKDDLMLEDHLKLQKEIAAAIERQKEKNASDKEADNI